ncbi:CRISPR-associated RAMP Cmr4 [hydrothermal vent metagenome]|uniref:CRISPR-associated RAMP Cmr4 n=1 Tax=hydrothermal vent metagenome TaxID=652676 RepID=A0A1W1E497_9ZZZZ
MTMKNNAIIGFMAETFIHSGCGQSQGAIDLPFSREKATDYPYIPGSSLKGAFKDYRAKQDTDEMFGKSDVAGNLLVSDLRLLLLPVRSLTGAYKWVTCPHILKRLKRDLRRTEQSEQSTEFSTNETYELTGEGATLFLEELSFKLIDEQSIDSALFALLKCLSGAIEDKEKIVIIKDDDFNWFAKNALSIQARNVLDSNKASNNLWYEESLPPDTLMYCLLGDRKIEGTTVSNMLAQIKE